MRYDANKMKKKEKLKKKWWGKMKKGNGKWRIRNNYEKGEKMKNQSLKRKREKKEINKRMEKRGIKKDTRDRGTVIWATKSCNSSRNIVALQVAERMLPVLPPCAQQIVLVAESRKSFYFVQQSFTTKLWVVIRATFTLQLATQQSCTTSCMILLLVLSYKFTLKENVVEQNFCFSKEALCQILITEWKSVVYL